MNQSQAPVIEPVDVSLLEGELTSHRFLRDTCKGGNKIYKIKGAPGSGMELNHVFKDINLN